jgi:hypothetical protein
VWRDLADGTGWLAPDQHAILFHSPPKDDPAGRAHLYGMFNPEDDSAIRLRPIPYEAAKGITWRGQSMAAGDGGLQRRVSSAVDALGEMESWSLDSSHWEDLDLDSGFSWEKIEPSYFGLIKEPPNIRG